MRFMFLVLISLMVSACGSETTDQSAANEQVVYLCADTSVMRVTFMQDLARVTLSDDVTIDLPIAVSGSGFRYGTPRHELRGKGEEATWTIGRRTPIQCRVAQDGDLPETQAQ